MKNNYNIDSRRILFKNVISESSIKNQDFIIYWMSRDHRIESNWSLIHSYNLAKKHNKKLIVLFTFINNQIISDRYNFFMLKNLQLVSEDLLNYNIPFYIIEDEINLKSTIKFLKNNIPSYIVTDFNPIKSQLHLQEKLSKTFNNTNFHIVDSHNIVPCFYVSKKQEYAAYTIRPKLHKLLDDFLTVFPKLEPFTPSNIINYKSINWNNLFEKYPNKNISFKTGRKEAFNHLNLFLNNNLKKYDEFSNNVNKNVLSNLSPYLNLGQISSHEILTKLEGVLKDNNTKSFVEQLFIRKELSDNYCYYNKNYDNIKGFPNWSIKTLNEHIDDVREYNYSLEEFENGKTHDSLWNTIQFDLISNMKVHSYLRMYWCKKILEWTKNPEDAQYIAIYLNDKYSLDGMDPNGYTGIAWSIGGVHDRAWKERSVFGKIRYMNHSGCKRKFKIDNYIKEIYYKGIDLIDKKH